MAENPNAPFILLAFANPNIGSYSELRHLNDEASELRGLFLAAQHEGLCQYIPQITDAILEKVYDAFNDSHYSNRIAVFHFAGHANSHTLLLETTQREPLLADATRFAKFLGEQKGLKLVFLNACSTQEQVEGLLAANVEVVIATTQDVPDELALPFAVRFYKALTGGATVASSFRQAKQAVDPEHTGEIQGLWCLHAKSDTAAEWKLADAIYTPKTAPPNMAKSPIEKFVERPTEYSNLRDFLCATNQDTGLRTAAVVGMGGFGKTTLVQKLCHDPQIIEQFPDGILWATPTENPDKLTTAVLELVEKLTGARPQYEGIDAARNALAEALGDKRILLVIDDVWQEKHLNPFLDGGEHCTRLVATPIKDILPDNAHTCEIGAMNPAEAVQLISDGLPEDEISQLGDLATRLGRYPLLLRIVNRVLLKYVKAKKPLIDAISSVDRQLTKSGLTKFDEPNNPDMRDKSVAATIDATLKLLEEQERAAYLELAIFPQGANIPLAAAALTWNMELESAEFLIIQLNDLSLLSYWTLENGGALRLHDVVRTYLRETISSDRAARNARFLDSYKLKDWTKLDQNEPYLWNWLAYHLLEAERGDELARLFADDRWMRARVENSNYTYEGFVADLNLYWRRCHARALQEIDQGGCTVLAECVRCALIATSINSLSENYVPALVVRAMETNLAGWTGTRGLSTALSIFDPQRRSEFLTLLASTNLLTEDQTKLALKKSLEASLVISHAWNSAESLKTIVPLLSDDLLQWMLDQVLTLDDESALVLSLEALAPRLNNALSQHALKAVPDIDNELYRAMALQALVPKLDNEMLPIVLKMALDIANGWDRATVLEALAPRLSIDDLPQALEMALTLGSRLARAKALRALAPRLSINRLQYVLDTTQNLPTDEEAKAQELAALAPQLDSELLLKALEMALKLDSQRDRADALSALTPRLTGELLQKVLDAALDMDDSWPKAKVLAALALQPNEKLQQKILDATMDLKSKGNLNENNLAEVLAALAPRISGEPLQKVLDVALGLDKEQPREQVLVALAPCLRGELLQKVLDDTLDVTDKPIHAQPVHVYRWEEILAALPQLSDDLLYRALKTVQAITDDKLQAEALAALAPRFDGESMQQALELVSKIHTEWAKAKVLVVLASECSEEFLPQIFKVAQGINDVESKVNVLAVLARNLTGDIVPQVLDAVLDISNAKSKADILATMAPKLSGILLQQALRGTVHIRDESARAITLATLSPQLKNDAFTIAMERALTIACTTDNEWSRAEILNVLATQLSEDFLSQALDAALDIRAENARCSALAALAPRLRGELLQKVLEAALDIDDSWSKAKLLATLAHQADEELQQKILDTALDLENKGNLNENNLAEVLVALTPQLNDHLLNRVLNIALNMEESEWAKAKTLAVLTPRLNKESQQQVLDKALIIDKKNPYARAHALSALALGAQHLNEDERVDALDKALGAALEISDAWLRAEVLYDQAVQLQVGNQAQVLPVAFEALVNAIKYTPKLARVKHMAVWAPRIIGAIIQEEISALDIENEQTLSAQRIGEIFQKLFAKFQIDDKWEQANILAVLATRYDGEMRAQAVQQGMVAAESIDGKSTRAKALTLFLDVVPDPNCLLSSVRQIVAEYLLDNFPTRTRTRLMEFISVKEIFTQTVFDQNTLATIAKDIVEITNDWKWLR